MHAIRHHRLLRTVLVLVTLAGWFVLSNHCALGRLVRQAEAQRTCCHRDGAAPEPAPCDGVPAMQCCQSLHALVPDGGAVAQAPTALFIVAAVAWVVAAEWEPVKVWVALPCGATGPPRALSFSELVLQRSLPAHAPPSLA